MADNTSDALLASIGSPGERPAKRPKVTKVTRACDRCKSRKRRCDGELPCSVCLGAEAACAYNATYTRGKLVEPRVSLSVDDRAAGSASATRPQVGPARDRDAAPDQWALRGDVSIATELPDPRSGLNGPSAVPEEVAAEGGQYAGPSSAYAFLKRAWERFGKKQARDRPEVDGRQQGSSHSTSVFSFGDKQWPDITPLPSVKLPSHAETATLLSTYFDFAMPTYRFLHRPTVEAWSNNMETVSPARQATVWMVLATASLFTTAAGHTSNDSEELWQNCERYYQAAQGKLGEENGRLQLEVVQARLAICLYLLHTSRPNEAWYAFGTTVQMMFALALHRQDREKGVGSPERIVQECRKRTFWAISTLDIYLSVMLGRPPLIHDEDVDQRFPTDIDDAQLVPGVSHVDMDSGDKVVTASILHAKIARIVRYAAREQVTAGHKSYQGRVDAASESNRELAAWHASLPVLLSGAVSPSSLIPVFRRQIFILRLAHAHASMLVNRGLLLTEACDRRSHVQHCLACINAARTTLDMLVSSAAEGSAFSAFWFTQYVAFNAVSIVYVWLIQRTRGRLGRIDAPFDDQRLFENAEAVQKQFADATHMNAPSLRYNIVLEELQQEARRLMALADRAARAEDAGDPAAMIMGIETLPNGEEKLESVALASEMPLLMERDAFADDETLYADVPLDPDLWLQLDSFPFSDAGLGDWVSSA